ncbi:non-ribosomal peptide synthetase [Candidatus Nitrospira neomarina]|uniref:Amino acid adenylation domain-containing protein n=1 Tax=Candidatus Nitrospira neomarina TaxID=3020899 RepID=A0AA96K473_9BACT|nr:non-ribosomal peptide synthetase [Candidatus Nitrospira neomarina]WNM63149.1 amino acid adenylation domain-containing protein [Candidatus Nitrospira neomarina]
MDEITNRIAALSNEQRALFENKLANQSNNLSASIPPRTGSENLPLSFAQQRLWFLDRFEPGSSFYNIPATIRLSGSIDPSVLERVVREIIHRHEVLRTTFPVIDGMPVQRIAPSLVIPVPWIDMRSVPKMQRRIQLQHWYEEETNRPFDLECGPLLRVGVLQIGTLEYWVVFSFHHIVFDGWSINILENEFRVLLAAFEAGLPSPLPHFVVQYADFALWQRRNLSGENLERLLSYWRCALDGAPEVIDLPTDRPRPASLSFRGARRGFVVEAIVADRLRDLARQEGATMFMVLCAAFQLLLRLYSGQEDILVGTIIANRTRSEFESLIGFFVNSLVLRVDFSGNPTFREIVCRVKETTLGALAHQDLPFERLVEELRPARNLSRNPLFQVAFVLQNQPGLTDDSAEASHSNEPVQHSAGTSKFDLTLAMMEGFRHVRGAVEYNTDLFDSGTVDRLVDHFCVLLDNVAADPDQRAREVSLLTPSERRALYQFNRPGPASSNSWRSICDLLNIAASAHPDQIALEDESEALSYAELNLRANQLSQFLMGLGIGAEQVVALFLNRSVIAPIALFGVLGAGGAVLPLDPETPRERLDFMMNASDVHLLLTCREKLESLGPVNCPIVCLDDEETVSAISSTPQKIINAAVEPDQLAYIIFTSGSTGLPKGVMVPHRGLAELGATVGQVFGHPPGSRVLQAAPPSFDAWIFEILIALGGYSTLILEPAEKLIPGPELTHLLKRRNVDVAILTPSAFSVMEAGDLAELNTVVFAAEASTRELAGRWSRGRKLFNAYGPTECTIAALLGPCSSDRLPPLGRPVLGTKIYVLDRYLNYSPPGCVGQIYIGGHGVARGYKGKPGLTADRFVPDPFTCEAGGRLYRTGDMARFTLDGELEFVGRDDDQVKLRGIRIELGEIQKRLLDYRSVEQAVVIVRRDLESGPRLVAYIVGKPTPPTAAELRVNLRQYLPGYMIPSAFVFLNKLPLNSNGKLSKSALPAPERLRVEGSGRGDPPRNSVEERIAGVWGEILGLERVMVQENFFDLGGHSLAATQVLSRLTDMFRVEVPLRQFFLDPTVSGLATAIKKIQLEPPGILPPTITSQARSETLPLSFAQERLWFLDRFEPGSPFYNIPASMRILGSINKKALSSAIGALISRHEVLRTVFDEEDGRPVQRILPEMDVIITPYDLRQRSEIERELEAKKLIAEEARRSFNLVQGPLFRVALIHLSEEQHILLVSMHHIIADGWSMGIVLRELNDLYMAFALGQPHKLPPLQLQYADFAIWQREWLTGDVLARQLAWWRTQLRGAPPLLDFPLDRPRQATKLFRGATYHFKIAPSLAQSFHALANREGVTSFMALLAAFSVLLYRYSGQSDMVLGTPIANRTRPELEGLIGLFVNTLALRCDLSGRPSFRELLIRTREITLGAYAHQDLPFERLVEVLQPERNLSHNPIFQVMFAFQNVPILGGNSAYQEWHEKQEQAQELAGGNGTAKFDLTLFLREASAGLAGAIEYNTNLFDGERIIGLVKHLQKLLSQIVEAPDCAIDDFSLLEDSDLRQMVFEWNDTGVERPLLLAHQLFERQALEVPGAIALEFNGVQLTYGELNGRANFLAQELRNRGVGPETVVAIVCERSFEALVGIMGVWKAGGAYLPADPENPPARLEKIFQDAGICLILTSQSLLVHFHSLTGVEVLCLDDPLISGVIDKPPLVPLNPANLAYIIYTSGSTGSPKGVMTEHAPLVNRLLWMVENHSMGLGEVVLQKTPLHFDVSVWEYLWPLSTGAKLVIAEPGGHRDPGYLTRLVIESGVTVLHFVPSMLPAFLQQSELDRCTSLKRIYTSGEELKKAVVESVFSRLSVQLHNMYGPTETAIEVTHWVCGHEELSGTIPIGWPLPNTRLYILDGGLQPTPVDIPGEIYIGGLPCARGYHRRGGLTAERFVPDPFGTHGNRMYRTGDRARFRSDLTVEFLGRLDEQVKIRGFRVETGEIEETLRRHRFVAESAVVLKEVAENDKRLIAYIVPKVGVNLSGTLVEDLRSDLRTVLPEYMVPSAINLLESMPRSASGKINRRELPSPQSMVREDFQGPRTQVELRVAGIWSQVLHIRQIDIRDRFFEIGGHSLLATQVIARVNKSFEVNLPLRSLFDAPSLAGFSALVAEKEILVAESKIKPITAYAGRDEAALLKRIDTMSDEEVTSLLAELSSEEDSQ